MNKHKQKNNNRARTLATKIRTGMKKKNQALSKSVSIDLAYIESLSNKEFSKALLSGFSEHKFDDPYIHKAICEFIEVARPKEVEYSNRRVSVTVKLSDCPSCGRNHKGYNVKIDYDDSLFVVCGKTRSKVVVSVTDSNRNTKEINGFRMLKKIVAYPVTIISGSDEDIDKLNKLENKS